MEAFAQKSKEEMKVLIDEITELNTNQKKMNTWFCADKDVDLIDMICQFKNQFSDAMEENKKREEEEAKAATKKKRVVIKKKKTTTRTTRKMPMAKKGDMSKMNDSGFEVSGDGEGGGSGAPPPGKKKVVRKRVVRRKKAPAASGGGGGGGGGGGEPSPKVEEEP